MLLIDVNVLVYAHREDARDHARYKSWLEGVMASASAYGMSELVLSGFIRVVTHPRIFREPTPIDQALSFAAAVRDQPNGVTITPGNRHWDVFTHLCRQSGAKGSLVADAYFAALAIESGCEWVTTDRDYARFTGLTWRHPLDPTKGPSEPS